MGHSSWTSLPVHFYVHDCPNRRRKLLCRTDILTFVYSEMMKRIRKTTNQNQFWCQYCLYLGDKTKMTKRRENKKKKKHVLPQHEKRKSILSAIFVYCRLRDLCSSCKILYMFIDRISIAKYSYHFVFLFYYACRFHHFKWRCQLWFLCLSILSFFFLQEYLCSICAARHNVRNEEPGKMAFVCNQLSKLSFCKIMNGYASLLGAASNKTVRAVWVRKNSHRPYGKRFHCAHIAAPVPVVPSTQNADEMSKTGAIQTARQIIDLWNSIFYFSLSFRLCLCAMFTDNTSRISMMLSVDALCEYIHTFEYFLGMFSVLAYVRRIENDATACYCLSLALINRLHLNRNYASTWCGSFSKWRDRKMVANKFTCWMWTGFEFVMWTNRMVSSMLSRMRKMLLLQFDKSNWMANV